MTISVPINLNCDDFGMTETINQAVYEEYLAGRLLSTSLLVEGDAIDSAVKIAWECPNLSVGLHLNLDQFLGYDVNGYYGRTISNVNWDKYKEALQNLNNIERSIRDQFFRFFSFNLRMSHVDSHHNAHLLPEIFESVVEIASIYQVKALRFHRYFYEDELFTYKKHYERLYQNGFKFVSNCKTFRQAESLDNLADKGTIEIIAHLSKPGPDSEHWRIEQFERLMSTDTRSKLSAQNARIVAYV